jgi:hypothetical protein
VVQEREMPQNVLGSWYNEPSLWCHHGVDLIVETCTERAGDQSHDNVPVATAQDPPAPYSPSVPLQKPAEGSLIVSPDGTCGGSTGFTCNGGHWGECCSQWGFCGSSTEYCDTSCQSWFGLCSKDTAPSSSLLIVSSSIATVLSTPSASTVYATPISTETISSPSPKFYITEPSLTLSTKSNIISEPTSIPIPHYNITISRNGLCGSKSGFVF